MTLRELETADLPEPPQLAAAPHTTRITGIGGSGVVTVAQTLAAAATIAGRYVRTLDQTGLAQKGGAVVSDIKIFDHSTAVASRAGEGECDLYLGCDLLVAAEAGYLLAADPSRTVAVVSSSAVPTGQMVADPDTTFPAISQAMAPILEATRAEHAVILDARKLATTLFGQDQFANMLWWVRRTKPADCPCAPNTSRKPFAAAALRCKRICKHSAAVGKPSLHQPIWTPPSHNCEKNAGPSPYRTMPVALQR